MAFLPQLRKDLKPAPSINDHIVPYPVPPGQVGKPYRDSWDTNRAVEMGYEASIWVYKGVNVIAENQARLPMIMRKGDPVSGNQIEHAYLDSFNFKSSMYYSAFNFRQQISMALLLCRQGTFIEVVKSRAGELLGLYQLPVSYTWPIPSEETFVSAYRVQFPGKCLRMGTMIFTKRGVLPVEDVCVGDEVLTHLGRWRKVTWVGNRPLNSGEKVYDVSAKGLDSLTLTGDHKVWAAAYTYNKENLASRNPIGQPPKHTWQDNGHSGGRHYIGTDWVASSELLAKKTPHPGLMHCMTVPALRLEGPTAYLSMADYMASGKFPATENNGWLTTSHRKSRPVPAKVALDKRLGRLLGLYLAEGWTTEKQALTWAFHEDEKDLHHEVVGLLADLFGVPAEIKSLREKTGSACVNIAAHSSVLRNLFAECGEGARTKHIPVWAWAGDADFWEGVLTGWEDGDGHVRRGGETAVTTVSRDLAWQMRVVAITCGREAYLTSRTRASSFTGEPSTSYEVQWTTDKRRPGMYRIDDNALTCTITDVSESEYAGPVYDLAVEDDHSFLTTGGMVHNSWFDIPAENVIWIRKPHPTNPYLGSTPLMAAGIDVEIDYYAKQYNRNFLMNDGRPGGLLVVSGGIDEINAAQLRNRFMGTTGWGPSGAGRITVMEAEDVNYIDTSQTARDAQYSEGRQETMKAIAMAFGVPMSMMGDASGRTYDNASAEQDIFWRETMLPHLETIARAFDGLTPEPDFFFGFNLERVAVLQREMQAEQQAELAEVAGDVRTIDEYRVKRGLDPLGGGAAQLRAPSNMAPITGTDETGNAVGGTPGQVQGMPLGTSGKPGMPGMPGEPQQVPGQLLGPNGKPMPPDAAPPSGPPGKPGDPAQPPMQAPPPGQDQAGNPLPEPPVRNAMPRTPKPKKPKLVTSADEPGTPNTYDPSIDESSFSSEGYETKDAGPDYSDSIMVCIYPPADVAQRLAVKDGLPADKLHVTLAYLGKASDYTPPELQLLAKVVEAVTTDAKPFETEITGSGQFTPSNGSEGQVPHIALASSEGLIDLRRQLKAALEHAGLLKAA